MSVIFISTPCPQSVKCKVWSMKCIMHNDKAE
jgi:hypothetical protein